MNKAERTRQHILEKASFIINKKGMAGTSLSEIMSATKSAKGCIYNHFKNKDELCLAAFNYLVNKIREDIYKRLSKIPKAKDQLKSYIRYSLDMILQNSKGGCPILNFGSEADDTNPIIRSRVQEAIKEKQQFIELLIKKGIEAGDFLNEIDVSQEALKLFLMLEGAILWAKTSTNKDCKQELLLLIDHTIEQITIKERANNMKTTLFTPLDLGEISLKNRIVMAPLTRRRSNEQLEPTEMMVEYYKQRSSAGLIITEASQICPLGQGYVFTPGIYTSNQIQGWKKITDTVHQNDGKIVIQLWHVGRVSHSSLHPKEGLPVAPSPIRANTTISTANNEIVPLETPRELTTEEIKDIVKTYRKAAENAKAAGFDGVELHSANGYLLNEFLHEKTNKRKDEYGGSIENRSRIVLEVLHELIAVFGSKRVGIRLSPFTNAYDIYDENSLPTYQYLLKQLNEEDLAYVHLIRFRQDDHKKDLSQEEEKLWKLYNGHIIAADGFTPETASEYVESGKADAIAFGRSFIANPDLPERIKQNAPLNPYDRDTFYSPGPKGYIDYPFLTK